MGSSIEAGGRTVAVSVIVLTYNSSTTIADCLAALRPQLDEVGGELVVVDNASTDDTVSVVRATGASVLETGANLGFAAGCNVGARRSRGALLVLVNPDAVLDPGALRSFVAASTATPMAGPLGGRAHHLDGSYDARAVHGSPSLRGALSFALGLSTFGRGTQLLDPEHGPRDLPADGSLRPAGAVSGAVMAVPRSLWEALGGFDERFFLYGEDIDLCVRARREGWQPAVVTGAGYHHVGGVSSAGGPRTLLFRGKVELYRRHLGRLPARVAIAALQFGVFLRGLPHLLPIPAVARRAAPWWQLHQVRARWRAGHVGDVPGRPPT